MSFRICDSKCCYEKERLKTAFDFKGNALTCLWQTVVGLTSSSCSAIGLGVQSVLWSDASVYGKMGEEEGNLAMYRITQYAVKILKDAKIDTPYDVIDDLFSQLYPYAKKLTSSPELRKTFVLNALVPIDLALWQLWCKETGNCSFDSISAFDGQRQEKLLNIPLITYNTPLDSVRALAKGGASLLKIKIGSDPDGKNDPAKMLDWDKNRIRDIHNAVKDIVTTHTDSGVVLYYLDANGRYDTKDRLLSLIDFADKEGFLDRIVLLEEPFDEKNKIDVHDLPITVAADESAHSVKDVRERLELGYSAVALKPIAKTLSETVRIADLARESSTPCFCADLTVNPVMVTWNQCVAARLKPLPRMRVGVVESNGEQNYARWETMTGYHPMAEGDFTRCENGIYRLDKAFYESDGGFLEIPQYYSELLKGKSDE